MNLSSSNDISLLQSTSSDFARDMVAVTAGADNEANLRHGAENLLEKACAVLSLPYVPFQFEYTLETEEGNARRADVVHGAVIIEYEKPKSLKAGDARTVVTHAKKQVIEYAELMALEEGRDINEYILVIWDGAHIAFGNINDWERIGPFDAQRAARLLMCMGQSGTPFVHPNCCECSLALSPILAINWFRCCSML